MFARLRVDGASLLNLARLTEPAKDKGNRDTPCACHNLPLSSVETTVVKYVVSHQDGHIWEIRLPRTFEDTHASRACKKKVYTYVYIYMYVMGVRLEALLGCRPIFYKAWHLGGLTSSHQKVGNKGGMDYIA